MAAVPAQSRVPAQAGAHRELARGLRRACVVGTAVAAIVLLPALPALAHITTTPGSARAGSTAVLTFHVPNEESGADTVKLDMLIPTAHPIAQLLVKPVPGWSISVRTVRLAKPLVTDDGTFSQAVSEVIWSGGRILPGQFQDFTISADPLPTGVRQLAFKAIQTYSNKDVVRWIDLPQPGLPAPAHPAPILTLTTVAVPARTAGGTAAAGPSSDGTARLLGVAGLAVGLLACLLAGVLTLTVTRRSRRLAPAGGQARMPAGNGVADQAASPAEPVGPRRDQPTPSAKAASRPDQEAASAKAAGRRQQGGGGTKAASRTDRRPAGSKPPASRRRG